MKSLAALIVAGLLPCSVAAQDIYKWEDEKGVVHYGDKPPHSTAVPLEKSTLPYSNTGSLPVDSPAEEKARLRRERDEARAAEPARSPLPSPSLARPKAWLDRMTGFWLSGAIKNSGKGLCEFPAVEVTVFDELGSVDGNFEIPAAPDAIARGDTAAFEGKYFTPVGDSMSWEAVPRCGPTDNVTYGARKRGTLSLNRNMKLRTR